MKNFKNIILIFGIIMSMLMVGCSSGFTTETTENTTTEVVSNDNKVIDREGNEITLPEKTDKIISLAPSITETLINLGLGDNLVAVDAYSLSVEGVNQELPVFDIMNPDSESIVALQPDIIFGTGMTKAKGNDPFAPMVDMGAFVTVIPTSTSVEGIKEDILFIGQVTKKEEEAKKIVDDYEKRINEVLSKIEENKQEEKVTVYFETSPMPDAYTFGQNTFLNDMISLLGAENIFSEEDGWVAVSEEQVVAKNPSVIITNADFLENPVEDIKNRAGWSEIDAVKNDRVYLIEQNTSSRANENSIIGFENMAKALYPDLFEN